MGSFNTILMFMVATLAMAMGTELSMAMAMVQVAMAMSMLLAMAMAVARVLAVLQLARLGIGELAMQRVLLSPHRPMLQFLLQPIVALLSMAMLPM